MATYDLTTGGAVAVSHLDYGRFFVARIPVVVSTLIAANATLTANAKITAADVIQIWDVPDNTVLLGLGAAFKIITPGTAAGTVNVGIAGSNELFAAIAIDAAAGTNYVVAVNAGWGTDNKGGVDFEAADTIDITFVADETVGSFVLYIPGYVLD